MSEPTRITVVLIGCTGRVRELVERRVSDAQHPEGFLPQLLLAEAPAYMMGNPLLRALFAQLYEGVFADARTVIIDGDSDCDLFADGCWDEYSGNDQRELQEKMMRENAQVFADLLALNAGHPVTVICTYTEYGDEDSKVHEVLMVKSRSLVP